MDATAILSLAKNFGWPAVLVVLMITGWLIPKLLYQREVSRADKWESIAQTAIETLAQNVRTKP